MRIISKALVDGEDIALEYAEPGAGGDNLSPDLAWQDAPGGTESFAVTCWDPDAPVPGGWWHWLVIDIPADVTRIPAGGPLPDGVRELPNTYGYSSWGGPCPPSGRRHRYITKVWALDVAKVPVSDECPPAELEEILQQHRLAVAEIVPLFTSTL